jgi:hypothetical protein
VRAEDELRYWEHALEGQVAVAVVVPPHLQEEDDLRVAGRWWWPETADADTSRIVAGVGKIIAYVCDHFDVDSTRVLVAGTGRGATAALWTGLSWAPGRAARPTIVAVEPLESTRFAEAAIPDRPPELAQVTVIASPDAAAAARETFVAAGLPGIEVVDPGIDFVATARLTETRIRAAVGLDPAPAPAGPPVRVRVDADTVIARQWIRAYARATPKRAIEATLGPGSRALSIEIPPEEFDDGRFLPLAPGPFGGTTVVVVPDAAEPSLAQQWRKLADDEVLEKRSRFAHLAATDAAGLPTVLAEIHAKGRRNVLIVPAEFAATPDRMQTLRRAIAGHDPSLTIHWLPGLGAALAAAVADAPP